jgi:hypothetical protein
MSRAGFEPTITASERSATMTDQMYLYVQKNWNYYEGICKELLQTKQPR